MKERKQMKSNILGILKDKISCWQPPHVPIEIKQGDMPGDKIQIEEIHIQKANTIFPEMMKALQNIISVNPHQRAVVSICGGSGVGKSETASLLSFYLHDIGIGSYTLSGDNYPHRVPSHNDAERLRVFRKGGLRGMISSGEGSANIQDVLRTLQQEGRDADPMLCETYSWLAVYQREGRKTLADYLGSSSEIDFDEVTNILSQFKNGSNQIFLKRMGRQTTEVWYELVDLSAVDVMVMEWTHSNSNHFQGVDYPILLNSTPRETLEHRKRRGRDGAVDSPFTTMVLELEQKMLEFQSSKAELILAKSGEILSKSDYRRLMAQA